MQQLPAEAITQGAQGRPKGQGGQVLEAGGMGDLKGQWDKSSEEVSQITVTHGA